MTTRGTANHRGRGGKQHNMSRFNELLAAAKANMPPDGYNITCYDTPAPIDTTAPPAPPSISTAAGDAPLLDEQPEAYAPYQPEEETDEEEQQQQYEAAQTQQPDEHTDSQSQHGASESRKTESRLGESRGGRPPREPRTGDSRPRHIPTPRTVDDIRKEDEKAASLYKDLFDQDEDITVTGVSAAQTIDNWQEEVRIHESVAKNIELAGYVKPRKIQSYAIPLVFDGWDVKGQAETGSGKSGAFLIPIISTIAEQRANNVDEHKVRNRPLCIIIEPTRELALQLYDQGRKLADNTNVQVVKAYGEYDYKANASEIFKGTDIVVGTPGRLWAFLMDGIICPSDCKWLVLDEADRLLDKNFQRDIVNITSMRQFPMKDERQTLLFSATFPDDVNQLIDDVLKAKHVSVTNKRQSAPNAKVEQSFEQVEGPEKKERVVNLLKDELDKLRLQKPNAPQQRTLVFVETKRDADVVALYLCQYDLPATTINGDRTQDLREAALQEFRDGIKPILVATDVCARGLDIKNLDIVINMDMPRDVETYIHRIGRTGRLVKGRAASFFDPTNDQDKKIVRALVQMLKETQSAEVPDFLQEAADAAENANEELDDLPIDLDAIEIL